mgnify:CR=1 FL=1
MVYCAIAQRKKLSKNEWVYLAMLLPGVVLLLVFNYFPMGGIVIAFEKFMPAKGIFHSSWVGLQNFKYMLQIPEIGQIMFNTVFIACSKLILGLVVPIVFALLLNEVMHTFYKRMVQTIVYLPHFLSWVIMAITVKQMFSLNGIVNKVIEALGGEPVMFLSNSNWFVGIIVGSDVWKGFGWGTIIYLAAISNISPNLYEAAEMDGASKLQQVWHVTLPGMLPTIVLMATLSLGNILNAGFDQIFNMYSTLVYDKADIIDTYVYRIGLVKAQYGLSTAVGLLKSVVSTFLIVTSYRLAGKFANYRIF